MTRWSIRSSLEEYAQRGVDALSAATPVNSGESAASWSFEVVKETNTWKIFWTNSHLDSQGTPIVILLEHGHATGGGGYVRGIDFINPAIRPVFDEISENVWRAVTSA